MTESKCRYIDLYRLGPSVAVVLFFTAIIAVNLYPGSASSAIYYLSILVGVVALFCMRKPLGIYRVTILAVAAGVLSFANWLLVGNQTPLKAMIMMASFFLAVLMISEQVDERAYIISVYMNALVVLIHMVRFGVSSRVYVTSSNNYVSIFLMAPGLLYYSLMNVRGKKCALHPAIVIWLLSFLMGGRGGVLACTLLLAGVILNRFFADKASRRDRVLLMILLVIIMIPVALIAFLAVSKNGSSLYAVDRFLNKGLDGGGRIDCWIEYITAAWKSTTGFLFGADLSQLWWVQHYSGNLHNSFLFVHAYMGILGLLGLLVLIVRACVRAIRLRKGLYLCCIITICFRGMTDHMFGGNRLSAVLIALLILSDFVTDQVKDTDHFKETERGVYR